MHYVEASDVGVIWEVVEPPLATMFNRFPDHAVPPDVLKQWILSNKAFLVLFGQEGFAIVQFNNDTYYTVAAAAFTGVADTDVRDIISKTIKHAKQLGFSRLRFKSPRPAWRRLLKPMGFNVDDNGYFTKEC